MISYPIPRNPMIVNDKLAVEGGLAETKIILGWHSNFRTLEVTLPEHKHIVWSVKIQQMISTGRTSKKALELIIGWMGHIVFVIPWVYHFLSHLLTFLAWAVNNLIIDKALWGNWHELTGLLDPGLDILFRLLPSWPWWLQQPRFCMAL